MSLNLFSLHLSLPLMGTLLKEVACLDITTLSNLFFAVFTFFSFTRPLHVHLSSVCTSFSDLSYTKVVPLTISLKYMLSASSLRYWIAERSSFSLQYPDLTSNCLCALVSFLVFLKNLQLLELFDLCYFTINLQKMQYPYRSN